VTAGNRSTSYRLKTILPGFEARCSMAVRGTLGMKSWVVVCLTTAKMLRFLSAGTVLVLAGRTFNASGQTVTNLYSFGSVPNDGASPNSGLAQGSDGNLYGVTFGGGSNGNGAVFRFNPVDLSASYTNLHPSSTASPNDGLTSFPGLVQGSDGNLYGTTRTGGTSISTVGGTVFRISPSGTYTTLYSFGNTPGDGCAPHAGLVQGSDGNFYGTTCFCGSNSCVDGCGTVFRIDSNGNYTNLHTFAGTDGANPEALLIQGSDGNFYGTTFEGGTANLGTVFKISPSGVLTTLYSFGSRSMDAYWPSAGLVQGSDGNFYGTAGYGTTNGGGSVFRITASGSETNLYVFGSHPNDGGRPVAGLVQGSDGNFYGMTEGGGISAYCAGCGTVFRISPGGDLSNLYSFAGYFASPKDGAYPVAGLVQASDDNFYGTTSQGGVSNNGIVFRLSVPLVPPPNQILAIQASGTNIFFKIPSIAYETYQLQFSSSMNPTNWVNVPGVSVTNSIGALLTLTNFGGAVGPQGFYRFAITP
jgi:uncharacterized repeat protein (TIGR03803 family)